MGKSISATVLSTLLKLWPKLTEEEAEEKIAERYQKGEESTPPPKTIKTRYVDNENLVIYLLVIMFASEV